MPKKKILTWAQGLLKARFGARAAAYELSISLVGDDAIRKLNRMYRNKDRPTDILSFSQREGPQIGQSTLLGDIVLSIPTAKRQATAHGWSLENEVLILLVHGLCHLLGYDHQNDEQERIMKAEEQRLIQRINPHVAK